MVVRCTENEFNIIRPAQTAMSISSKYGCSFFQAALLEMRGLSPDAGESEVSNWLSPDMEGLLEGLDLGESNAVASDLFRGLTSDSHVVVYGDYDVDGISATTLAMEMVMRKGARVRYFIPHRFNQGYGVHTDVATSIAKRGCDLVIVVDCGSQDVEAVRLIKNSGIPVVIFDHHIVEAEPAPCDTLINPQAGGNSLARQLCAAGVLWCWAWRNEILPREQLTHLLDLVALATVADCVSLASPLNRVLVQEGLGLLRSRPRTGLSILMDKLGVSPQSLDAEALAMKIIPCLNAAGRLALADYAVKILFPGDNLGKQVDNIITLNQKRRELSAKILTAVDSSESDGYQYVLTNDKWSVGVLSSVASRICAERCAPVALVASVGEIMRGTLRMPKGGDAVGALKELSPFLNTWGGHRLAAGFSVKTEKWVEFRDKLESLLSQVGVEAEKEDLLHWMPGELDMKTWSGAEALGPFGMGNPAPLLYTPCSEPVKLSQLGTKKSKHVKIDLGGSTLLGFGASEMIRSCGSIAGWVYKPRLDTWRNVTSLQLVLEKMVVL